MLKERFRKFLPVVVDLETGGFDSKKNAILEISLKTVLDASLNGTTHKDMVEMKQAK